MHFVPSTVTAEVASLADADVRVVHDAMLVGSIVLDDRQFRYVAARASRRTADAMRGVYIARATADGATQWTNSGATAVVDGLFGPLTRHV